jgi:AraC-like DNA-binding protein
MSSNLIAPSEIQRLNLVGGTQILLCGFIVLEKWEIQNLAGPFWRWYCNDRPGASLFLPGGRLDLLPHTVYLIPPNVPCSTHTQPGVGHLFIHFSLGLNFHPGEEVQAHLPGGQEREMIDRLRKMFGEPQGGKAVQGTFLSQALVNGALETVPEAWWREKKASRSIEQSLRRIREAYPAALKNSALAREAHLSVNAFTGAFREATGFSPHQYLLKLRLEQAAQLLQQTALSIDEIAEQTGFCDRFHFSRTFKRHLQHSPAIVRQQKPGKIHGD